MLRFEPPRRKRLYWNEDLRRRDRSPLSRRHKVVLSGESLKLKENKTLRTKTAIAVKAKEKGKMINLQQPATKKEGFRVTPLDWEQTRESLEPLYNARTHWILVAHIEASPLIQEIERRYYPGDRNADFTLVTAFWRGQAYALVAARKRWMQGYQLVSLYRQLTRLKIKDDGRDLLVVAPLRRLQDGFDLAVHLFDRPALAMAA